MKNLKLYQPFSRQEFEKVLAGFSIVEVPKKYYQYGWMEQSDGSLKYDQREKEIWEICYFLEIYNTENFLLIFTSIDRSTGWSRKRAEDAIRTVLVNDAGKPLEKRRRRLNRVGTWKKNLIERVLEYTKQRNNNA